MWHNRENVPPETRLKQLQEELSLANLKVNKIGTVIPDADKVGEGTLQLVNDGTGLHLVTKVGGVVKKATFT